MEKNTHKHKLTKLLTIFKSSSITTAIPWYPIKRHIAAKCWGPRNPVYKPAAQITLLKRLTETKRVLYYLLAVIRYVCMCVCSRMYEAGIAGNARFRISVNFKWYSTRRIQLNILAISLNAMLRCFAPNM